VVPARHTREVRRLVRPKKRSQTASAPTGTVSKRTYRRDPDGKAERPAVPVRHETVQSVRPSVIKRQKSALRTVTKRQSNG
jgi:hypothetical protein